MELKVKTDPKKYFRQMLEILDFMPQFKGMSNREKDVFSELLRLNWIYRALSPVDRWRVIYSPQTKEKIRLNIDITKAGFNTTMNMLRKRGLVTYVGIKDEYMMSPDSVLTIKFYNDAD